MRTITIGLLALAAMSGACSNDYNAPDGGQEQGPYERGSGIAASQEGPRSGFGFSGTVSGAPTGMVFLTGGGSFVAATASDVLPTETIVSSGGGFRCLADVAQGPLNGCLAGQGVRWDATQLLASSGFRCTGADAAKTAFTGPGVVALLADFFRAGDGTEKSFTARIIVADHDIAPDLEGNQTLWVQGVGCDDAQVSFNR